MDSGELRWTLVESSDTRGGQSKVLHPAAESSSSAARSGLSIGSIGSGGRSKLGSGCIYSMSWLNAQQFNKNAHTLALRPEGLGVPLGGSGGSGRLSHWYFQALFSLRQASALVPLRGTLLSWVKGHCWQCWFSPLMLEKEREQPSSGQENSITTETSRKKSLKIVWICIPSTGGGMLQGSDRSVTN